MAERIYARTLRRRIAAPSPLVWALVADTNRYDRAAGLAAAQYETRELRPGDPTSRAQVARARQLGVEIEWIEPPYQWIEGRSVAGERTFLKGPVTRGGFRVDLVPDGDATEVTAQAYVAAPGPLGFLVGSFMRAQMGTALGRYLESIDAMLTRGGRAIDGDLSREPPAAVARRGLVTAQTDPVISGAVTPVSEADFAFRAKRLAEAPVDAGLRAKLCEHLRSRPDEDVGQIRPFELARAWGKDRREVLRAFLHAARAGLVDLRWQLNCPTCRVASDVADSLAGVSRTAHCAMCNIEFELDFAAHVEAVFGVNASIRKVEPAVYCASSPWFRPHVFAQLVLPAQGSREAPAALPRGGLLFRTLGGRQRATIDLEAGAPAALVLTVRDGEIAVDARGEAPASGDTALTVRNETGGPVTLLIERAGWSADIVLGSAIATLPDFMDLFATEAPRAGVELTVGAMTLLFTDLTGSTAMYEKMGDARAFAVVQEHFRAMTAVVDRRRGAIVKTMGDAVMAAFAKPADAVAAALEMVEHAERDHGAIGLTVKVGLHEGPCLVVRANDKMDFFGTTVNVAARLQAQAKGSQVVLMESLLEHPEVGAIVREHGAVPHRFQASLKGIREAQALVAIDAGALAGSEGARASGERAKGEASDAAE